jgi:hypothetical protein
MCNLPELAQGSLTNVSLWGRSRSCELVVNFDTCQDYFFSVSQQDIDRLKAGIREQTSPLHHRRPVTDVTSLVDGAVANTTLEVTIGNPYLPGGCTA